MIPLHPECVGLLEQWTATNSTYYRRVRGPSRLGRLVERDDGQPFDRRTVHRYVDRVAKRAGVGHVHPHQLRHTLATRMINRGMSLEAIAALLGHRSMRMTLTYARRTWIVAEEYFRVTQAVEESYETGVPLPASVEGANMKRIAAEHRRLLGNGHCTRPIGLDCTFESVCERQVASRPTPVHHPAPPARRDADRHGQEDRAQLLEGFIEEIDGDG